MIKVAFINPPHIDWSLANNFAYLMFQSHYKRHGKYNNKIEWIEAPYRFNQYRSIEDIYEEIKNADIFLFSSYVWNYDICDELAKYIKKILPNACCVLGGPQIGTNDPKLMESRNFYDFILTSTKPGEVFVTDLIDSYIENNGKPNYQKLSWELRSSKTCSQFMPDYSVYEEHIEYLTKIREYCKKSNVEPFCILETTRGCPYSCSFCEWGGGIGSKIYKKNMDVVKKDILSLKKAGFRNAYLTDANFGAFFERDLEIFKFAWSNGFNLTDISTMKSKDLKRRIELVDAWFDVVGANFKEENFYSINGDVETNINLNSLPKEIVPTVTLQSISDEAMKVAKRVDLSFEDKIKLSEHIRFRCQEEGYPVPSIELILGMPGSTIDDFYEEFNILWNFQAWGNYRHDYMFLPDTSLSEESYIEKYQIELVEVYTNSMDDFGVDNTDSLYNNKRQYFKTIASCYSYSREEFYEMWFMNIAGNCLFKNFFSFFDSLYTPSKFGRTCFQILKELDEFQIIMEEIKDILNPITAPRNLKKLQSKSSNETIKNFINENYNLIYNELFSRVDQLIDDKKENKKIIPILEI
jgi:putative methyltransferase